jgi:hypothetical protein
VQAVVPGGRRAVGRAACAWSWEAAELLRPYDAASYPSSKAPWCCSWAPLAVSEPDLSKYAGVCRLRCAVISLPAQCSVHDGACCGMLCCLPAHMTHFSKLLSSSLSPFLSSMTMSPHAPRPRDTTRTSFTSWYAQSVCFSAQAAKHPGKQSHTSFRSDPECCSCCAGAAVCRQPTCC